MKKQVLDILRNSLLIAAVASVSATHSVAQTSSDYNKRELLWQVLDQSRANDYVPMAMTMKGGLYIIVGINKVKRKQYEKTCIDNSSITEYQHQQHLG